MKPRFKMLCGAWICTGELVFGIGRTPKHAWQDYNFALDWVKA